MNISSRLPSPKEVEILSLLLNGREMYGLEMVKASEGALKRGTIYVLLDRLEDRGFVTSRAEKLEGVSGMPRRLYQITGQGQRALHAMRSAHQSIIGASISVGA